MDPSVVIALVLAFGVRPDGEGGPIPRAEVIAQIQDVALLVLAQGLIVLALGWASYRRAGRLRDPGLRSRRSLVHGWRAFNALSLGLFAYMLFELDWPGTVERGLGLRGAILIDELLILSPFLIGRVLTWWGLYPAERAARAVVDRGRRGGGLGRYLLGRARQTMGLVLPATLLFALGNDVAERLWPGSMSSPYAPMTGMFLMGLFMLVASPALVRLTWPTRSMPPGPLRDRLERLAGRLGFRYSDILVWETGGAFVNAGVTGALPWYRYVLLTDTLVEGLEPREVEAVFGHEVGHIAHRHLVFFGFFFVGSLGLMAMLDQWLGRLDLGGGLATLGYGRGGSTLAMLLEATIVLGGFGLYFLLVFGFLSRRFERQADVYGCRAVSCDLPDCPPHRDINASVDLGRGASATVCPVGIRIFADALANVAVLNGIEPRARSWRHGSIARRIAFLEGLEGSPDRERRFQAGIRRLRLAVVLGLVAALLAIGALGGFLASP